MSTIGPPPRVSGGSLPTAPTAAARLATPTSVLANVSVGTIVQGVVIGRDSKNHTLLRTPNGTISLITKLALPTGSTVSLQVQTVGAQMQMIVLSVDQHLPSQAAARTPSGTPAQTPGEVQRRMPGGAGPRPQVSPGGGTSAGAAPKATPPTAVATGAVLAATVTRLSPPGVVAPPAQSGHVGEAAFAGPRPGGSTPGDPTPGGPAPAGAPRGSQDGSRLPLRPAEGAPPTAPTTAPSMSDDAPDGLSLLETGSRLKIRVLAVEPGPGGQDPAALLRTAERSADGPVLIGTLTRSGSTALQVHTPQATLAVAGRTDLPAGTTILLEVLDIALPDDPAMPTGLRSSAHLAVATDWPALRQAIEALRQIDPIAATHLLRTAVPHLGTQLASGVLFFLAALRGGDIRGWLGDAARMLEEGGHGRLVTRLQEDFREMARVAPEPGTSETRPALLPLYDGNNLHFARLFVRRHRGQGESGEADDGGTRFLVEVELSRLGAMQFDGLVRRKRFDLIVRTHQPFPARLREDVIGIFAGACETTGITGGITFQTTPTFPTLPFRDLGSSVPGVLV